MNPRYKLIRDTAVDRDIIGVDDCDTSNGGAGVLTAGGGACGASIRVSVLVSSEQPVSTVAVKYPHSTAHNPVRSI